MIQTLFRLLAVAAVSASLTASAATPVPTPSDWHPGPGHPTLVLWPHGAPGPEMATGPERNITTPSSQLVAGRPVMRIANVSVPTITLYAAPSAHNSHAAVVVFPGGAYQYLAIDLEGTEVCTWLNSIGVNCILLKYRVPNTGPYPKSGEALQDAQRAMGLVREHAAAWHIDPNRIGIIGFSAGGYMAAPLSTHYERRHYPAVDAADRLSCKPDFAMIIYPGWIALAEKTFVFNPGIPVTSGVPPTFLVQAEDDPVHVENVVDYFMKLKQNGVPAELHVYTKGGHGYGLRPTKLPITHWPKLATTWLHTIGVLPPNWK